MQTGEKLSQKLVYFIVASFMHGALTNSKYKFITLWLNTTINSSTLSRLHLI